MTPPRHKPFIVYRADSLRRLKAERAVREHWGATTPAPAALLVPSAIDPHAAVFVAEVGVRIVGCAALLSAPSVARHVLFYGAANFGRLELAQVWVAEAYAQAGVADGLVAAATRYLDHDAKEPDACVLVVAEGQVAWYARHGFLRTRAPDGGRPLEGSLHGVRYVHMHRPVGGAFFIPITVDGEAPVSVLESDFEPSPPTVPSPEPARPSEGATPIASRRLPRGDGPA